MKHVKSIGRPSQLTADTSGWGDGEPPLVEFCCPSCGAPGEGCVADWCGYCATYPEVRGPRPTIVCLCGSTRFWREFQAASLRETMAGKIVLSIGAASGTDEEHFGNLTREEYDRIKARLDALHLRKIDLADEVLILNVGGYIGESTRNELDYARVAGKTIRFLEEPS